jgi:hypothetical protein
VVGFRPDDEDAIAPRDWRGVATSGDLGLPLHTAGRRPVRGQLSIRGSAVSSRSAPSWPFLGLQVAVYQN